jgi:hypothetical protein
MMDELVRIFKETFVACKIPELSEETEEENEKFG